VQGLDERVVVAFQEDEIELAALEAGRLGVDERVPLPQALDPVDPDLLPARTRIERLADYSRSAGVRGLGLRFSRYSLTCRRSLSDSSSIAVRMSFEAARARTTPGPLV
jgi:hypothetical protein